MKVREVRCILTAGISKDNGDYNQLCGGPLVNIFGYAF